VGLHDELESGSVQDVKGDGGKPKGKQKYPEVAVKQAQSTSCDELVYLRVILPQNQY
jgi:hypothetical protein